MVIGLAPSLTASGLETERPSNLGLLGHRS